MPALEALYYPQWDPPSRWLRSSLLFFDKVSVIVPTDAQPEYCEANLRLRDVLPDTFDELREDWFDPQLNEAQLRSLAAALDDIAESAEHDEGQPLQHQETAALHSGKVTYRIADMLRERGLVFAQKDQFIHTSSRVAYLILSLLADRYGTRRCLWTLTDDPFGYSLNVLNTRDAVADATAENQLATAILSASVPAEIEELEPENFVELRKRYEPLRAIFQTAIRDIARDARLKVIEDGEALKERLDACTSTFVEGVEEVKTSKLGLSFRTWENFGVGTAIDVVANIASMTVPLAGVPLAAGWRLVNMVRAKPATGEAIQAQRLIAGLQRELIEPSLFRRLQRRIRAQQHET